MAEAVTEKLVQVHARHFCAGFVSDGKIITEAAPILIYMVEKPEDWARLYIRQRGWTANIVPPAAKNA